MCFACLSPSRLRLVHPVLAASPLVRSRAGAQRSCSSSFYLEPAPEPRGRRSPTSPTREAAPPGRVSTSRLAQGPPRLSPSPPLPATPPHAQPLLGPVKSTQGTPSAHPIPIPDQGTPTLVVCKYFYWAHPEIGASGRGLRATKAPPRESCPTGSPPGPVAAGPPLLASGSDSATLNLEPEPRTH